MCICYIVSKYIYFIKMQTFIFLSKQTINRLNCTIQQYAAYSDDVFATQTLT